MITNRPTILLLDREDMLRDVTAMMLSRRGASVHGTASIEEATELASERVYDVAIIDQSDDSPPASDLVERMRELGCLPKRVIVCTRGPVSDAEGQFSDVIAKPYAFDRLLAAVFGAAVRRRPAQSGQFPRIRQIAGRRTPVPAQRAVVSGIRTPRRASQARRGLG
jgi:DNA-binding NtrC family response regulator